MEIFIIAIAAVCFFILFCKSRDRKQIKSVTQLHRGTPTERALILTLLKLSIQPKMIFHDLYINKHNGEFSQVDLVVATEVGIIVIEVKDYSGWIFGNCKRSQWTQVLAYGKKKYRFYNPIMQNNKHIVELQKKIRQNIPFYSVIVFYGNCELKDIGSVPDGTYIIKASKVPDIIKRIVKNKPANYTDKRKVVNVLSEAMQNGSDPKIRKAHIKNLKRLRMS